MTMTNAEMIEKLNWVLENGSGGQATRQRVEAVLAALSSSPVGAEPPSAVTDTGETWQARAERAERIVRGVHLALFDYGDNIAYDELPRGVRAMAERGVQWRIQAQRTVASRTPAQAEPAAPITDESAWLIERDHASTLLYWTGRAIHREPADPDRLGEWSPDNRRALRFARRTDAECMLTWHCQDNGRVVEHMWVAPATPSARPTPAAVPCCEMPDPVDGALCGHCPKRAAVLAQEK